MLTPRNSTSVAVRALFALGLMVALAPAAAVGANACLIISEVVMGAESGDEPRWIEITNTGLSDFHFVEGGIIIQMDSSTDLNIDVNLAGVTIPAGVSFVICSFPGAYYGAYFSDPDLYAFTPFGDGDDRYILTDTADGSNLLDIYGEFGVDGTGTVWEYTCGYSYRLPNINSGNGGIFDPSEWFIGGVNSLTGPNPSYMLQAYTDPQRHTWDNDCIPCPGDLNGDMMVNLSDLAQLLGNYGMTSGATYEDGDLDGDGDVDLSDLAALLGVYGTSC